VSDSNVVSTEVTSPSKVSSIFYKSSTDSYILSLKSFFERPINIGSGKFTPTDTVSTFSALNKVSPHDFIRNQTLRSTKLSGFLGFRATSVLRLVVNATRFQQGRYMLTFVPFGGSASEHSGAQAWVSAHTCHLIQRTQLPHVEIDLNCDTQVELKIPYISCANYTPTTSIITDVNKTFAVGQFMLFPYSPLVAASGSVDAGFTLWHHFEDVELICPAIPQSGRFSSKTVKKNAPTDVEKRTNGLGLISTPLAVASDMFSKMSLIPGLSAYAQPASWVTERLSKCASIFGWSRPADTSVPTRTYRSLLPNFTTIDANDTSLPLSLSAQNCVTAVEGFSGTDVDELDFKNFNTIFSYFKQFSFTTTNVSGDTLTTFNLNPNHYWTEISGVGGKLFSFYQPLAFTAQYFQYWRGSLKFKLKIVKTEFHSGRIAVAFSPIEAAITAASQTYATSDYLHREIYDIRESSEIEFVVPFVSSSAWKPVFGDENNVGTIAVYVVDPLIAPDTVSNTITFLLEVAGGEDLSFAVPLSQASQVPVFGITPQSGNLAEKPNVCLESVSYIGGSNMQDNIDNSAYCIGEHVSSWRSLLKMFIPLNDTTEFTVGTNAQIDIVPYAWDYYYETAAPNNPNWTSDFYGTMCSIFALSRGGVRFKFADSLNLVGTSTVQMGNPVAVTTPFTNLLVRSSLATPDLTGKQLLRYTAGVRTLGNSAVGIPLEVAIPQYHRFHSRSNIDHMCNTQYQYTMAPGRLATRTVISASFPTSNPYAGVYRSCSDDGNFGMFVSIPPMTIVPGTTRT